MNRRVVAIVLAAVFILAVVVAVVVAVTGGGGGDKVAGPTTTTSTTAGLNATARKLADRMADVRKQTLHLVYTGELAQVPEAGTVTVEVWWKGALGRQSIVSDAQGTRQEQESFTTPDGNVLCNKPQGAQWICQRFQSVASATGRPGGLLDALVAQLNGKNVTVTKAKVGGTDADCYTIDPASGDQLCLREDGVPLKFSLSGSALTLSSADSHVTDTDFQPPAKPTDLTLPSATTTTTKG